LYWGPNPSNSREYLGKKNNNYGYDRNKLIEGDFIDQSAETLYVLNSLFKYRIDIAKALDIIEGYLQCIVQSYSLTLKTLTITHLQTPQQPNKVDCGIFAIEYIRIWLCQEEFDPPRPEFSDKLDCSGHRKKWIAVIRNDDL